MEESGESEENITTYRNQLSIAEELIQENASKAFQEDTLSRVTTAIYEKTETTENQQREKRLFSAYRQLNKEGQVTAIERIEELAQIPKFKRIT